MKTNITIKIVIAGAMYACSCFASTIGIAAATCPGTPITGFGGGAFATSTWQTCGTVMQAGSNATIDTTTSANNASLATMQAFLSPQMVSSQGGITPVEGGAVKTTFTSGAGNVSFNYNFFSDPSTASYGFMLLDGTQYDLGDNAPVTLIVLTTIVPSMNVAIGAGSHNIAFGVMNGNTLIAEPNLTITNLTAPGVAGIPEPATFGLVAGAFALAFMWRRYSQVSRS